ncbi:nicotinamide mononucleotide-binding protein [Chromobacterium haemolyticum]|uniref:AAA family ATPase n=1 Tax=Chromobacterium haemolyticum TaxID=394935 RepID=UPI0009D99713|nr:ATP-binding protein [Chromobacterium haemolyticum]OQS30958.1 nicotinamide mononucleotide-binding protein [Chromobacterium haemolyticum]
MFKGATRPLKIAIVGPESCGKTTLARALAAALNASGIAAAWAPEYARDYFATRPYRSTPEIIEEVARGQLAAEQALAAVVQVLLCDTTALNCKIWSEVAHGRCSPGLLELYRPGDYALTLLAEPDIPWEPDPLRSHPTQRDWLFGLYRQALEEAGIDATRVSGAHEQRMAQALAALAAIWPGELPKF